MARQVEFFFDFGSPYTYLAWFELQRIAAKRGAQIVWRPMLLGGVFQATGNRSPAEVASKGRYSDLDLARWAAHYGVKFKRNPDFPINTLTLMRGAVGMQMRHPDRFQGYLDTIFRAMWEEPRNLGDPAQLAAVLQAAGFDVADFQAMVADPAVKEQLKKNTEEAVSRGVFGAPAMFVGNELYWGNDRLLFVDQALARPA